MKQRKVVHKNQFSQTPMWRLVISSPFIYSIFLPTVILDIVIETYHQVCFRLYGIQLVSRKDYIYIGRHKLKKLDPLWKLNCMYCGYVNGFFAYAGAIAGETERFWCAIKHAPSIRTLPHQEDFFEREDFS